MCSDRIRNELGIPTMLVCASEDEADTAILAGRADLCLFEGSTVSAP
jgi:hypothetical protein